GETELGFLRPHLGYGNETVLGEARGPVDEGHVHLVRRVLHPVEEVARPDDDVGYFEHALIFHFGEARQWWWVTLTQVGEDEAQVLLGRIAADADLSRKGGVLGRLLHALACVVVLPTVIEAANAVALDPACRELGAAMRAAERQQVRLAAFTSIEREVLAHDTDGQ